MNCFAYYYGVYYQCLLSYPGSVGPAACQYIANWTDSSTPQSVDQSRITFPDLPEPMVVNP